MPHPYRYAARRPLGFADWKTRITLAVQGGLSLAWLASGIVCLLLRLGDAQSGPLLASSGAMLVAGALVQVRLMGAGWRTGRLATRDNPTAQLAFWRWLLIGALLAYLAALALPPQRYVGCAWLAAVCGWHTLLLLPLAASPIVLESWRNWTQRSLARRLAWLVYASMLVLFVGEASLRAHRAARDSEWFSLAALGLERPAALTRAGETPDVRMTALKPARFRVAILGEEAICGDAGHGYLDRVEQTLPGLEIVPLAGAWTASGTRAGDLAAQVAACDADLVLAVISVCEDLARRPPECGYFDWRQFELAVLLVGSPAPDEPARDDVAAADFESYLRALAPQLTACRTPINDAMRDRWQQVFESLDEVIAACRDARVPVALVIVPAEFQVNGELCRTLLRRYGLSTEGFDVELPQRRLAGFAAHREVPLIDLLPHLRLCRQSIYRRHTTALNDEGNSAAASAIGGWLQSRYAGQLAARLSSN